MAAADEPVEEITHLSAGRPMRRDQAVRGVEAFDRHHGLYQY